MTTMPPESSSPLVLHDSSTSTTNSCDYGDIATFRNEVDGYSSRNAHNESALDALAALAAASTAVSQCPEEPDYHRQYRQISASHQDTILCDDDSERMPPPPPRSAATILESRAECNVNNGTISEPSASSGQTYTFATFHREEYPSPPSDNCGYIGGGRLRSASNPEGMEKWDLYSHRNDRQHFVLPSSILEEELASTRRVLGEIVDESEEYVTTNSDESGWTMSQDFALDSREALESSSSSSTFSSALDIVKGGFLEHDSASDARKPKRATRLGTSPDSVLGLDDASKSTKVSSSDKSGSINPKSRKKSTRSPSPSDVIINSPPSDEDDEANLEPEELLRRARARLLEDLSEGGGGLGSNGGLNADNKVIALILPHSLTKYKEVYNKNGRIGVYTPAERAAIIHKFNAKRARRVWNKKIRYNCRKNLADRRMRVKGRFVKRGVEATDDIPQEEEDAEVKQWATKAETKGAVQVRPASRSSSSPFSGSPLCTVNEEGEESQPMDEEMPDVEDEDAGFEPSEDMPFRRPRRYTIT